MKAFIWYPGEVAEAISLASATSQSDQWQSEENRKKSYLKILDSSIFELEWHAAPQKNFQTISNSNLNYNWKFFLSKFLKKMKFMIFASKKCKEL